jgi:putative oxidoreductase
MTNQLFLVGRICLAVLFVVSGFGKLTDASAYAGYMASQGLPSPLAMTYVVGCCELLGGLAVVIGFQTRILGIVLALYCVATGLIAHRGDMTELMKNIGLAGGFLLLAASGPGSIALFSGEPARRTL